MKLTEFQIQELYSFTQKHYVDWYDVQIELVDHLANGIEEQWKTKPNMLFDDALKIEFKKFGIMGFGDVIEEKTKALNAHYRKLVWKYFKAFFKLPKIILTGFLIWTCFQLFQIVENRMFIVIPSTILLFCFPIVYFIKRVRAIKRIKKETGKKWLFDNTILQFGELIHILNIGIYGGIIFDSNNSWSNTQEFIFALLIVLFGLALYVSIFVVSPQLRKDMTTQYPDYKII